MRGPSNRRGGPLADEAVIGGAVASSSGQPPSRRPGRRKGRQARAGKLGGHARAGVVAVQADRSSGCGDGSPDCRRRTPEQRARCALWPLSRPRPAPPAARLRRTPSDPPPTLSPTPHPTTEPTHSYRHCTTDQPPLKPSPPTPRPTTTSIVKLAPQTTPLRPNSLRGGRSAALRALASSAPGVGSSRPPHEDAEEWNGRRSYT